MLILTEYPLAVREASAGALKNLSLNHPKLKKIVGNEGAIHHLVRMLYGPTSPACIKVAAEALRNLALDLDNQAQMMKEKTVTRLCAVLRDDQNKNVNVHGERDAAAGALWTLSMNTSNREELLQLKMLPWLLGILSSAALHIDPASPSKTGRSIEESPELVEACLGTGGFYPTKRRDRLLSRPIKKSSEI